MTIGFFSWQTFQPYFFTSIPLVGTQLCQGLPMILAVIVLGRLNDSFQIDLFGLSNTILSFLFIFFITAIGESLSIKSSPLNGNKQYARMGEYLWKALSILLVLFVVFTLLVATSYRWLTAIGIKEELSIEAHRFLIYSLPYLALQGFNIIMLNYANAQNITTIYSIVNVASIVIVFFFSKLFIDYMGYMAYGYIYTKTIQEVVILAITIYIIRNRMNRETLIAPSYKAVSNGFSDFGLYVLTSVMSFAGTLAGFETNTYCAALSHDDDQLAVWILFVYLQAFYFFGGLGFSFSFRSLIGNAMGEGRQKEARTLSIVYFKYNAVIAFTCFLLIFFFAKNISRIFTNNETLVDMLTVCCYIYIINLYAEISILSATSMLRLVGKQNYQAKLNGLFYIVYSVIMSPLLAFGFGLGVYGLVLSFCSGKAIIIVFMMYELYWNTDWEREELLAEEKVPDASHDSGMVAIMLGTEAK